MNTGNHFDGLMLAVERYFDLMYNSDLANFDKVLVKNGKGDLVIDQRLINTTDDFVNFKCLLFAPGRRRMRQNVLNLSRGTNTKSFVIPDGKDLIGKTIWVRAEEIAGERILNYRFEARP